jgi:hypothetical protein
MAPPTGGSGKLHHQVDHIILGTARLDEGIDAFAERTGVRPVFGGNHPGRGTRNALVALGGGQYLEILAPQPDAPPSEAVTHLRQLAELTPIGWAVSTTDVEATIRALRHNGFDTSPPSRGSRMRPDGTTLEWTTLGITKPQFEGAPFFIRWSTQSVHPSRDSPTGCNLTDLTLGVPDRTEPQRLIALLGLRAGVRSASRFRMELILQCPKGDVRFPAQ